MQVIHWMMSTVVSGIVIDYCIKMISRSIPGSACLVVYHTLIGLMLSATAYRYVYCIHVCLLHTCMSTAYMYVYCIQVCLLHTGMSTAYRYVYCIQVCLLHTGMSTAYRYVYCIQVCLLHTGMSTAYMYVYCIQVCLLHTGMSTAYRYVHCIQVCPLLIYLCSIISKFWRYMFMHKSTNIILDWLLIVYMWKCRRFECDSYFRSFQVLNSTKTWKYFYYPGELNIHKGAVLLSDHFF